MVLQGRASWGSCTAAQIALDDLEERLSRSNGGAQQERVVLDLVRDIERYLQSGLQIDPQNEYILKLEADYLLVVNRHAAAEIALRKAFNTNPRQDWIAVRLARLLAKSDKLAEAKSVMQRCLNENPSSKLAHQELALLYLRDGTQAERDAVIDHLQKSFTRGDANFFAQYLYARELFLRGRYDDAQQIFGALKVARLAPKTLSEVRDVVKDMNGQPKVFDGIIVSVEETFLFIRSADFGKDIFLHRSRVREPDWAGFQRNRRVKFNLERFS